MSMKKKLIATFCALCCAGGAVGLSACKNAERLDEPNEPYEHTLTRDGIEYEWSETDRGFYVSAADPSLTTAVIPASVDEFRVIGVSSSVFRRNEALTSVSIAKGVTEIGEYAFCDCTALSEIDLPEDITKIGNYAFRNTAFWNDRKNWDGEVLYLGSYLLDVGNLKGEYTIKDGTVLIADEAFAVDWGVDWVTGGCLGDMETTDWMGGCIIEVPSWERPIPADAFSGVTIPESVKHIGDCAFYHCEYLENISLPNSVETVGANAFAYTAYAKNKDNWENDALYLGPCLLQTDRYISGEFKIKDGTKIIDERAFYERERLEAVRFPDGLKTIGDHAFYQCPNLEPPTLPDGLETIGDYAFYGCPKFERITLPKGLKKVGQYAFYDCPLQFVTIPKTVQSMGKNAFRFTQQYANVYLSDIRTWCTAPSSFATIAHDTFLYLYLNGKPLTELVIPKGVTTVRNFENCEPIVSVRFSDDVVKIDDWAFRGCRLLNQVTFPSSLKSIGRSAFNNCTNLTSLKIPKSVTQIGENAFLECSALQTIELPSNLTELGTGAFRGCEALEKITLPSSLTKIEDSTFSYCKALKEFMIPDGVTSIGSGAFSGCTALTSITIPEGITTIENATFYGCTALRTVSLPRSVTEISMQSFGDCTSLTNLTYKGTLEEWRNISRKHRWNYSSGIARVTCTDYYIEI